MLNERRFVRYHRSKRPVTISGGSASSTDPSTWTSYLEASQATVGAGVGYVLGNGVGCIDLDHCMDDGVLAPWAQEIVDANPDTYIETSMSGDGLHIFGLLEEAPGQKIRDGRNIEVYSRGRYIALTFNRFEGSGVGLSPISLPS